MRLNHITLQVADVERSTGFYVRLGLRQIVASYPDYSRLQAPDGEATLSLQRSELAAGARTASIHFEVDDVDRVVTELRSAGFTFAQAPVDQPYLWREAIVSDPDGNSVFIYHAGSNRLDPPWRVDGGR